MRTRTGIEWTEITWEPTTGCGRISAGCNEELSEPVDRVMRRAAEHPEKADT